MNEILKIVGSAYFLPKLGLFTATSLIVLWKWSKDHLERKELSRRKRIEAFNTALLDEKVKSNPYVIEQYFLDRYGRSLKYREIKYLLRQENPSPLIMNYLAARAFLKLNDTYTYLIPRHWIFSNRLRVIASAASILFVFCGMAGLLSLIVAALATLQQAPINYILGSLVATALFFAYAALFFEIGNSAGSAIKLQHIIRLPT